MAPKMAIKDVARVQKLPLSESDRLSKLVPDRLDPKKGQTAFQHIYEVSPEMRAERDSSNETIRRTLEYAERLEGSVRQTGVHACGVIIGKDDLELYAPLATVKDKEKDAKSHKKADRDEEYKNVVQFEGGQVEDIGLIKMDFLGLRTLSIIKDALKNIKYVHGEEIDIDSLSLDDAKTYQLFAAGETHGLFQFESAGMRKHLRNLRPTRFEDLIAMNALYRPGPMDYIPQFIRRKNGDEPVVYELPEMEQFLADTYGVTVYQEQVMLLSQKLAGFTGGQADTLRKAMGKKQREMLDKMRPQFVEGARAKGHDPKVIEKIWSDWEAFASYAFNKSHSTCYAYIAYQTGWLKAHYPSEFMAALLSRNLNNIKEITLYMQECKRMRITVLGPDVNESYHLFSSDKAGNVRFGLAGI
jgi:DNA polymerase-3 subunit alpha